MIYIGEEDKVEGLDIGTESLLRMRLMKNTNIWIYNKIKPFLGKKILEIGSGIGRISQYLVLEGRQVILTDSDDEYIGYLHNRFIDNPMVRSIKTDICDIEQRLKDEQFDTIVGINILEHIKNDLDSLMKLKKILKKNGRLVLIVPAHEILYSKFDRKVGHYRRYSRKGLIDRLKKSDFIVEKIEYMNFLSAVGWFINFKILMRKHMPTITIWFVDKLIPLIAKIEKHIHFTFGLSLFAIAKNEK